MTKSTADRLIDNITQQPLGSQALHHVGNFSENFAEVAITLTFFYALKAVGGIIRF